MAKSHSFTFVNPDGSEEPAKLYRNPDGTVGGWVAPSATIHPTAVIEPDAIVEPGATVGMNEVVKNGSIILGPIDA